ncbi:hypothetical protein HDU93_004721 [Gonapodya sp. JEL0774]|nr:hypothetical protein HDU93_004721 [Gonapodya sp. JEL0774]
MVVDDLDDRPDTTFTEHFYTAPYASGRAVITSLLDTSLFLSFHNDKILPIMRMLSGIRFNRMLEADRACKADGAFLRTIPVPVGFEHKTFLELYEYLSLELGAVPLGIYRKAFGSGPNLGNRLPFVITNPVGALKLRETDSVFVLVTDQVTWWGKAGPDIVLDAASEPQPTDA